MRIILNILDHMACKASMEVDMEVDMAEDKVYKVCKDHMDCMDCMDCMGCTGCTGCMDRTGCTDCTGCTSCMGCMGCMGCRDRKEYKERKERNMKVVDRDSRRAVKSTLVRRRCCTLICNMPLMRIPSPDLRSKIFSKLRSRLLNLSILKASRCLVRKLDKALSCTLVDPCNPTSYICLVDRFF